MINACDAGREGELIFRNVIRAVSKTPQPMQPPLAAIDDPAVDPHRLRAAALG